jgi:hypothetical protein
MAGEEKPRAVEFGHLEAYQGWAIAARVRRVSMTWPCTITRAISPRKASM